MLTDDAHRVALSSMLTVRRHIDFLKTASMACRHCR